jgi:enterochelin esterase-like enzyme
MNRFLFSTCLLFAAIFAALAQPVASLLPYDQSASNNEVLSVIAPLCISVFPEAKSKDTTGEIVNFPDFKSKYVDPRNVDIWLPESYRTSLDKKYPVLYMHDGQVLFQRGRGLSGEEWEVDEMMTKLISEEKIRGAIVVGIQEIAPGNISQMGHLKK